MESEWEAFYPCVGGIGGFVTGSKAELRAVQKLLEVGKIFQSLYETQRHHQALQSLQQLQEMDRKMGSPRSTQGLLALYRLSRDQ